MVKRTYLSTERASILGVLGDFNLLDLLTQRGTIASTVFTRNAYFLGTLGLKKR